MNALTRNENKPIASYLKRYMEAAAGKKQADEQPAEARAREVGECKADPAGDTAGNKLGSTTVAFARDVTSDDAVVESNVTVTKATAPPPPELETTTATEIGRAPGRGRV